MKKIISKIRRHTLAIILCCLWIPAWGIFIWAVISLIDSQQTYDKWVNEQVISQADAPIPTYPSTWDEVGNNPMCKCSASFNISFPDYDSLYLHGRYYYVTQYFIMDWADRIKSITHDQYDMANLPICETVDLP